MMNLTSKYIRTYTDISSTIIYNYVNLPSSYILLYNQKGIFGSTYVLYINIVFNLDTSPNFEWTY